MFFRNVPKLHGLIGIGTLTALAAVACGSDKFSGCEASRTCAPQGGESNAGEGGSGGDEGGESGTGAGAMGGMGGSPECTRHADCNDGDDVNGVERCVEGSCELGNPPPSVESVTPPTGEADIDVETAVEIEFSERLDPDTVTADSVRVTVNGVAITGEVSYDEETTVTFTPSERWYLGGEHTVTVTTDVTDLDGAALLEPFESSFEVRDGTWGAAAALPDAANATMPRVVAVGAGDLLVAWSSTTGLVTRWYRSTGGWGDIEPLDGCLDCTSLVVAGNRAGDAIVAFASDTRVHARQYRGGEWESGVREVVEVSETDPWFSVAMSPTGEAHVLVARKSGAYEGALIMRGTNAEGEWTLMDETAPNTAGDAPQLAFDANGDGLAVWGGSNGVSVYSARYDRRAGAWSAATPIRSSQADYVGPPAVAFGEPGTAMAIWTSGSATASDTRLMASAYSDEAFATPAPINGANEGMPGVAPQLVFDGSDFVAAWTETRTGNVSRVYTNRYADGDWQGAEPRDAQIAGTSYYWMPYLGVDGVGNLHLLWRSATAEANWDDIVSSRYARGAQSWSAARPLSAPPINLDDREFSLAVSPNGVSAVLYRYQLLDLSDRRSTIALFE